MSSTSPRNFQPSGPLVTATPLTRRRFLRTTGSACLLGLTAMVLSTGELRAQTDLATATTPAPAANQQGKKWVATWSASTTAFGNGTVGSPVAQPDLKFALPTAAVDGLVDQTVRMVVKPDLWAPTMRFRLSNVFGDRAVTFRHATVGLQSYAGNPQQDTLTKITFNRKKSVTIPKGEEVWSDAIDLPWVKGAEDPVVVGHNLLVSVAVHGTSGLISWHGKAVTTNYLTPQGSGDHTRDVSDADYPYSSTSWYFLNAVDVMASSDTAVVCCFGDSITDGTATTINGNDRWSNDLSRRLHAAYGNRVSVVNQGIGGNTVNRPLETVVSDPAVVRLDRDVLGLSGLTGVVWLEGINDVPASTPDVVIAGYRNVVDRLHAVGIKVIAGTVTSAVNPSLTVAADAASNRLKDDYRKQLNVFIRGSGIYDSVADMDAVTLDPVTGALKAAFLPPSSVGGLVLDYIHPNRAGYQAMANTIDLTVLAPVPKDGQ